ncbi:MAG: hypothetical protein AABX28_01215 [Nanoarchaeota archaeon]
MIGTISHLSNDVWVYLMPEEISRLERQILEGDFINSVDRLKGKLTLEIDDKKCRELAGFEMDKSEDNRTKNLFVYLSSIGYKKLIKSKRVEFHLGYAHVNLIDISSMDERVNFHDVLTYEGLNDLKDKTFLIPFS